jgi:tetratricopeptide (TPR) repeat protein
MAQLLFTVSSERIADGELYMEDDRKLISCCMITRDEEDCIAGAIRSVSWLADEVIVVDTGSTDDTVSIAESEGARVFHHSWGNDFSEARNYSISKAEGDWILILDADETIDGEDHDEIRRLVRDHAGKAFMFVQKNYSADSSTFGWRPVPEDEYRRGALGYHTASQVRLFPNVDITYSGRVHENVELSLEKKNIDILKIDSVSVHHYGRMKDPSRIRRKHQLYLDLGREKLEEERESSGALFEFALQLFWCGDFRESLEVAEKGLSIDEDDWKLLNLKGLASMRAGKTETAEQALEKAVRIKNDEPDLYNNLGSVLLENNRLERALSVLKKGIKLDGGNSNLLRNAASAALALGDLHRARDYIEKAKGIDPFIAEAHAISAEIHQRKGDREKALRDLGRIEFIPETSLKVWLKAVQLYVDMNRIAEAEKMLEKACSAYPGNQDMFFLRGKIAELKGDLPEALMIYRRVAEMRPEDAEIRNCMGCVCEKLGDLEKGLECFEKALNLDPNNGRIELNIGIIYEKLGLDRKAEEIFRGVIDGNRPIPGAHNVYGCFLARNKRYGEAIRSFTRFIEEQPDSLQGYLNLGKVCEEMNLPDKAVEIYRSIPVSDPEKLSAVRERIESLT